MTRKGQVNEFWHVASLITDRLCQNNTNPDNRERIFKITLGQLSRLCGSKAKVKYDLALVYLSWEALADKAIKEEWGDIPSVLAVIRSYPKTAPAWIEAWPQSVVDNIEPWYESLAHDTYVRKYAPILRLTGWTYKWQSDTAQFDGSRLTFDEVRELGLLGE